MIDQIRAEIAAHPELYGGKTAQQIADIMNNGWDEVADVPVKTPIVDAWGDPVLDDKGMATFNKTIEQRTIHHDATIFRVIVGIDGAPNSLTADDVGAAL